MRYMIMAVTMLVATPPALAQAQPQTRPCPLNSVTNEVHLGPQGNVLLPSIRAMQQALTELPTLQLQTKQAHWNVSGTLFYPLHGLLQEHYEDVAKYADEVAERLQGIGVSSDGRASTIVRTSGIPEFPGGFVDDAPVIQWFAQYYRVTSDEIGQEITATNDSDPTGSNLLEEVQHAIDQYQRPMRAMIQATPTDPNTGADHNSGRPGSAGGRPSALLN